MFEIAAIFLVVFGVISLLTSFSAAGLLASLIVVALLCLLCSGVQKGGRRR